jgi:hypothetical protein
MQIKAAKFNTHLRLSAFICGLKKIWAIANDVMP